MMSLANQMLLMNGLRGNERGRKKRERGERKGGVRGGQQEKKKRGKIERRTEG